jgi:hypothetical protein
MPRGSRAAAAPTWIIRSVAVRTRDGPERLDQVYRRLIDEQSLQAPQPTPGDPPSGAGAAHVPEAGR